MLTDVSGRKQNNDPFNVGNVSSILSSDNKLFLLKQVATEPRGINL
jgi:hypothetical protein